jgi:WXG100 family type VII secretion target
MAGGIRVTPEQLRQISSQLNKGAGEIERILGQLGGAVQPLAADWQGTAQAQFQELWSKWQRSSAQLKESLVGIGNLTQQAAAIYEQSEADITRAFNRLG